MNFRHFPAFCALLLIPLPALAWSPPGHEIAAAIALKQLTPKARAEVGRLLGSPAMMIHDANWADEIRDARPETGRWHYVDIPLRAARYDWSRDCRRDDCAVEQIERYMRILYDRRAGASRRAEALRFVIHFVPDLHQPLHAVSNDDKGGNLVRVRMGRKQTNLHAVWDNDVVAPLGGDSGVAADQIARAITPAQRRAWSSGTQVDWANESHAIAREHIYPQLAGMREVRLPRDYAAAQTVLARQLVAKAGTRLAWLLNMALK